MEKNFDHITVKALKKIAKDGLVDNFLIDNDLSVAPEVFIPVSEVRALFDAYTEKKSGVVFAREFFELLFLANLEDVSVSSIEVNGEDVEFFMGIGVLDHNFIKTRSPAAMRSIDEGCAFSQWQIPAMLVEDDAEALDDQFVEFSEEAA
jgi:hypothetical protein